MNIALWLEGARPKTLFATFSPVLLGTCFALKTGHFSLLTFLITLLYGLAIQIGTNYANDYYDFIKGTDTSTRKGPRRLTQSGLVSPSDMRLATFLTFSFAALLSIYLTVHGGPIFALLSAISIFLGIAYTGGPYPIAYLGLGELFVILFFGLVSTAGTAYLQTLSFSWDIVLLGLSPGLFSTALLAVTSFRDIDDDRKVGKKTLAARFGKTYAQCEYTFSLLGGILIPLAFGYFLPLIALIPAIIPLKSVWKTTNLIPAIAQTGKVSLLTTLLTSLSILYGF